MNGIHDMGGLHGFGAVTVEPDEPPFHEPWEARVFGMVQSLGGGNIDAGRHSIERLDPVAYLKDGYFGRWLAALERTLRDFGILAPGELEERMRQSDRPLAPVRPRGAAAWKPAPRSYLRPLAAARAFALGQPVKTTDHQPSGHTRLPAYARRRRGAIVRLHPAMVFPDDHAHGRGENPQYLYTVGFAAAELWGDGAEPAAAVHLDLFESYLEPA